MSRFSMWTILSSCCTDSADDSTMSTFVIVHGAWGGGWEWSDVAGRLRDRGHIVCTPTLTGLGERSHLCLDQRVGLSTHVEDVVATVEFERLEGVVLCGASYGGMPVTVAADRLGDRVRSIIYVDALVPLSGQCALDLLPPTFATAVRHGIEAHGAGWRVSMPDDLIDALVPPGSIAAATRRNYLARLRDHPAASLADPATLAGVVDRMLRSFIRCTAPGVERLGGDPIAPMATRAREQSWPFREIPTRHDPHVFEPKQLAELLEELGAIS